MAIKSVLAAVLLTAGGMLFATPAHADGPVCVPMKALVNLCRMPDDTLAACPVIGGLLEPHRQPVTPQNEGCCHQARRYHHPHPGASRETNRYAPLSLASSCSMLLRLKCAHIVLTKG
jgi:hypothetical protein